MIIQLPVYKEVYIKISLGMLWLLVNIYCYHSLGIKYMTDSPRYVGTAQQLIATGRIEWNYNYWSAGYIFFLYCLFLLGASFKGVVLIQVILSGFAALSVFKIASRLHSKTSAYIATFLYVCWFPLQSWNMYLLTESLFITFSILSFWIVLNINSSVKALAYVPILIFSAALRPMGFLLLLSSLLYFLILLFQRSNKKLKLIVLPFSLILFACILLINSASETYASIFINIFKDGQVIGGYRGYLVNASHLTDLSTISNSLWQILVLIIQNPLYALKLSTLRLLFFFAHIKPFYSIIHNLFIIATLYPIYFFFTKCFFLKTIDRGVKIFALTFILGTSLIVMITTEDWDGRYLFPLLPFVFVFAAIGFEESLIKRKHNSL